MASSRESSTRLPTDWSPFVEDYAHQVELFNLGEDEGHLSIIEKRVDTIFDDYPDEAIELYKTMAGSNSAHVRKVVLSKYETIAIFDPQVAKEILLISQYDEDPTIRHTARNLLAEYGHSHPNKVS